MCSWEGATGSYAWTYDPSAHTSEKALGGVLPQGGPQPGARGWAAGSCGGELARQRQHRDRGGRLGQSETPRGGWGAQTGSPPPETQAGPWGEAGSLVLDPTLAQRGPPQPLRAPAPLRLRVLIARPRRTDTESKRHPTAGCGAQMSTRATRDISGLVGTPSSCGRAGVRGAARGQCQSPADNAKAEARPKLPAAAAPRPRPRGPDAHAVLPPSGAWPRPALVTPPLAGVNFTDRPGT